MRFPDLLAQNNPKQVDMPPKSLQVFILITASMVLTEKWFAYDIHMHAKVYTYIIVTKLEKVGDEKHRKLYCWPLIM